MIFKSRGKVFAMTYVESSIIEHKVGRGCLLPGIPNYIIAEIPPPPPTSSSVRLHLKPLFLSGCSLLEMKALQFRLATRI